ncbi:MAG: SET domain-containing protein, partial [Candidatus Paceibacterota bacterium]
RVKESKIQGKGLFTDKEFNEGDLIGLAHANGQPTPMIGKFHNHSVNPNSHSINIGNNRYIVALRPLRKGEEITVDYRKQPELEQPQEFEKGGETSVDSETSITANLNQAKTFNEAFKIARNTYGANHIFEFQGRKYGTNLKGETFKPSDEVLSLAGLNNNKVKETLNQQNDDLNNPYISKSTIKLQPDSYKPWEEIKEKNKELNSASNADKIIQYQNQTVNNKNYVIIDKQKGLLHIYQPGSTKPLYTSAVDLGANKGDAQTVTKIKDTNGDGKIDSKEAQIGKADFSAGNKTTGAGKFYISNIDRKGYQGLPILNMMNESQYEDYLKTGNIENVATSFHKGYISNDDARISNGCIRCSKPTLKSLTKYLENSSEVYVLPEEEGNTFKLENGKLNLSVKAKSNYYTYKGNNNIYKKQNGSWYASPKVGESFIKITDKGRVDLLNKNALNAGNNFYEDANNKLQKGQGTNIGSTLNYIPIKTALKENEFRNDKFTYMDFNDESELKNVKSFVKSLEDNKQKVMKAAKINGDVYNDIAKITFGIFGTESNYADTHSFEGNLIRASAKYFDPTGSSSPDYKAKYNLYGAKEDNRSVGLTQIRWSYLNEDEKKALSQVGIKSNKDFMNPTQAALGTAVILGIRYNQQLTDKEKKDVWNNLPKKWNTRDNYSKRVTENSKYLNLSQKVTNSNSASANKKDKWGRPSSSKWYGFNPETKRYEFKEGGALLTKKVTCKKCGWKWDAADGGDDITTCHKCGGQGLIHAQG